MLRFFVLIYLLFSISILNGKQLENPNPLILQVYLNKMTKKGTYHCYQDNQNHLWFPKKYLSDLGFPKDHVKSSLEINAEEYVALDSYSGVHYEIDTQQLILHLETPLEWEGVESGSDILLDNADLRPEHSGFFINYDALNRYTGFNSTLINSSAYTEQGIFTPYGVGLNVLLFNGINYNAVPGRVVRLETTWIIDQPERIATLKIGDSISSGFTWNGTVRFGGIQFATNFSTQPNLITFPQHTLRAEAVLPSSIDLLINDAIPYHKNVERGVHDITDIPMITGAGEIEMTMTDMLGRKQITSFSYYTTPILLKPGLSDFSFELGAIRRAYGVVSNTYGRGFGIGTYRLGLTPFWTSGVHFEVLKNQQTLGLYNNYLWDTVGVFSLGLAISNSNYIAKDLDYNRNFFLYRHIKKGMGVLGLIGFRRENRFFSYGVESTFTTPEYNQIGTFNNRGYPNSTSQAFIGINNGDYGSLAITWASLKNVFNFYPKASPLQFLYPNSDILLISYNKNLFEKSFLTVGSMNDLRRKGSKQFFITLNIPLDQGERSISFNGTNKARSTQGNVQLVKNLPVGRGYGYRLAGGNEGTAPIIGDITFQTDHGNFGMFYTMVNHLHKAGFNARGGFVGFQNEYYFTRFIDQGFGLVDVPGYENVDVYFRNQKVGKTDRSGRLYIPELLAYQENIIEVKTTDFSLKTSINKPQQSVVPYFKSGVLVKFDIKENINLLVTLKRPKGEFVPVSSTVYVNGQAEGLPVGYFGQVFMDKVTEKIVSGYAVWDNQRCHFSFPFRRSEDIIQKETVTCY